MDVLLDTDIGDDIDDAFALALLLRCPELTLRAITTSITGPRKRSGHARRMCDAAAARPEILDGAAGLLATRPRVGLLQRQYHYGHGLEEHVTRDAGATRFLDVLLGHGGPLLVIGGMTNAGLALAVAPEAVAWQRVVVMAGEFEIAGKFEHNITCDPESAHAVFASGRPVDVIPWSIGPKVKLQEADIARLRHAAEAGDALVRLLVDWLEQFWQHYPGKTNMYDPMTVVALLKPELFTWKTGRVTVDLLGERPGLTHFAEEAAGPHRVAFDVDADAARRYLIDRIVGQDGR